jgi:TonB family protein
MRKAVVAILSLSSCLLSAQASTPASTQDSGIGNAQVKRVSTGVVAPKLIYKVDVVADSADAARLLNDDCKVVVSMIVDKNGKPSDLKIVQSAGASVDASVLAAVSQYRFAPGTVSNQPIATPLNLEVLISNSYR